MLGRSVAGDDEIGRLRAAYKKRMMSDAVNLMYDN